MSRIEEIEGFVQVVESGSFSKAASRLKLTKSTLSRRVAQLEARLGVQLLNRTTRKISLNEAGDRLYKRCSIILADLEEAESEAGAGQTELRGTLKIAAPTSFGQLHMKPVLSEFMRAHENITVDIDFNDRQVDIVEEGFDVAVRIGVLPDSSLIARKLTTIRSAVVASPTFWDAHGRPKTPEDLSDVPCLRYSNIARPGIIPFVRPDGERGSISPPIRLLANDGQIMTETAIDTCGFVVEPSFLVHQQVCDGLLEVVLNDHVWLTSHLYVIYPPTRRLSARVRAFVDLMVEHFAGNTFWEDDLPTLA